MTAVAFQRALAELVANGTGAVDMQALDPVERERVTRLFGTRGVATMRMLYMSWRLTKVLSLLPLTLKLLGDERSADMLHAFWRIRRATSLHFVAECLDFAAFLRRRVCAGDAAPPFFAEILAFEAARLEMRHQQSLGHAVTPQRIRLTVDPGALLAAVAAGGDLAGLPQCATVLCGNLAPDGSESWTVEGGDAIALDGPGPQASAAF